jgi:thiol-disulfide isomerase/thioredoxin
MLFARKSLPSPRYSHRLLPALVLLSFGMHPSLTQANHPQGRHQAGSDLFSGGVAWINTSKPIRMADLKGKIVILDFWTYCCINCHHIIPELEYLEKKYPNEIVVIGVHSPKFPAERDTEQIRKKVAEYRIKHPVVNDANQTIWNRLGVDGWPTIVVFSATGEPVYGQSGEGQREALDQLISKLIDYHKPRGELDTTPLVFPSEDSRPHSEALLFPGKVLANAAGNRLFISDTGHNRIVVTDLKGNAIATIGSGEAALKNGEYERAAFHRPQGMCLIDSTLYVADTENHAIRAVDLESKIVRTLAGTGEQAIRDPRLRFQARAEGTPLNSPWDLLQNPLKPQELLIAMAGPHQLWALDLEAGTVRVWAGSGRENIIDGPPDAAAFAQPSGLATDGKSLFVADSEVSGIRAVDLQSRRVDTVVGVHLFGFGDVDGTGDKVRLQHCLGVAYADGKLYIADTYNNKIKVCDPPARKVAAFLGQRKPGFQDETPAFDQPGGLSIAGSTLFVADTNNHAIRAVDLQTRSVQTLKLNGVSPPAPPRPRFPNAAKRQAPQTTAAPGPELALKLKLPLDPGFKVNPEGSMPLLVEIEGEPDALDPAVAAGIRVTPPSASVNARLRLAKPAQAGDSKTLKVSIAAFVCREGKEALCTVKNFTWTVPVTFEDGAAAEIVLE